MDRRSALNRVGLLMGATFVSSELFITGCKSDAKSIDTVTSKSVFENYQLLLAEIGSIIIPSTGKHPGFKAINGIETAMIILANCYKAEDTVKMATGLATFESSITKKYNKSFLQLSEKEKYDNVAELDKLFFDKNTKPEDKSTFYGQAKESFLLSYFTNKKVMTGPLTYKKVPGKYEEIKVNGTNNIELYGFGS